MKKLVILFVPVTLLMACDTREQSTLAGTAAGAALGAAVSDDEATGALIGGVVGGVAGNLIGRSRENPDQCVYRDAYGNSYVADCP